MARSLMMVAPLRDSFAGVDSRRDSVIVVVVCVLAALVFPASAAAFSSTISKGPFDPEAFAISPPRYDFDAEKITVQPGDVKKFDFYIQSRFNHPIDVDITLSDIESSDNPVEVLRVVRRSQYGASN